jgi:enterochelin esterase-like enzyme
VLYLVGGSGDLPSNWVYYKITHEYYVGGYGGHDWATWRHLLYYRFLPNLWRKK